MSLNPNDAEKYRRLPWSLAHIALNNFFYTWTFGSSVFLLFLDELGLPKDQIGVLLALFPFSGLLALAFASLIAGWGRKRVFLLGYGIRKPVMACLLILPWIYTSLGKQPAMIFLFTIILSVAILRALAETAFIPWYQEYVPNAVRGKYASISNILTTITSILALWFASWLIARASGLTAYMVLIISGAVIGLVGVALMLPVPGGKPIPGHVTPRAHTAGLLNALQDNNYRYYMGGMASFIFGLSMMGSFLPLFLKDQLAIPAETVVGLEIASMVGGTAASLVSGFLSDRVGSRPVMMPGLVLTVFLPAGWIIIATFSLIYPLSGDPLLTYICGLMYFLAGVFTTTASLGAGRMLYNEVIPVEKNTPYTSIYYAWAGLIGGLSPILAGRTLTLLSGWHVDTWLIDANGYHLLFLLSLVGLIFAVLFYARVKSEH
jgi:MFS family permease